MNREEKTNIILSPIKRLVVMPLSVHNIFHTVLDELQATLDQVSEASACTLLDALADADRIFVAGAGRSGLVMRSFAMRLMHLDLKVHVVGETTTPAITDRDILLIGSGSGATNSLLGYAERAKSMGAQVGLMTIRAESSIGQLSDIILTIPAPTPKITGDTGPPSIQPMGTLFEQGLLLTLDAFIILLMDRCDKQTDRMFARHANME